MKQKKSLFALEIFPIGIGDITYHVSYPVLKGLVESDVATFQEREIYAQVKFLFEKY